MKDADIPNRNLIVKPLENLEDAPFDAERLIKETINPPEPPLELTTRMDPWSLPASVGVVEEIAPIGAVEVGGAGTGTWMWISGLVAGNPIGAAVLLTLGVATIAGGLYWGLSTPSNASREQVVARGAIANNPLPDGETRKDFIDAAKTSIDNSRAVAMPPGKASPLVPDQHLQRQTAATNRKTSNKVARKRRSSGLCGPGYYVNPRFLAGEPWTPGQSICMPNP